MGVGGGVEGAGETEIGDFEEAGVGEEDVGGFEIAVDDVVLNANKVSERKSRGKRVRTIDEMIRTLVDTHLLNVICIPLLLSE